MKKKSEFYQLTDSSRQNAHGSTHTHTHTHTLIFNRNKFKERFEKAFTLAKTFLKTLAALLSTTSSPRGRRYKCGQLVAQQLLMRGQKHNFNMCHDKERENRTTIDFEKHKCDEAILPPTNKRCAFSMAEMLITLTIIGIVAVFTIGIIVPKIQQKTLNTQVKTAKIKVTKAMEQMVIANKVGHYYNTSMDFAKEFSGFLKIAKICDKDHLSDCLGYKQIVLADGEKFNIAEDVTNGSTFGMIKDDYNDYTGDTVGIQTIDGASMILAWNKKCPDQYPYQVFEWANDTNGATSCIAAAIDVNGKDGPNQIEKDIVLLNALRLGNATSCAISVSIEGQKICWSAPFPANIPLFHSTCESNKDELGIKDCREGDDDYWGYAVYKCGGTQNLPTAGQLYVLAKYLYQDENGTYPTINISGQTTGLTLNTDVLSNLSSQFPTDGFSLWSGLEYSQHYSYYRNFGPESTYYYYDYGRANSTRWAVCSLQ